MNNIFNDKDELIMKLVHYFVTKENYAPILVNGVQNEIWLENLDSYYKIIRINTNYLHNTEQVDLDTYKILFFTSFLQTNQPYDCSPDIPPIPSPRC